MPTKQQARVHLIDTMRRVVDVLPQAMPELKAIPKRDTREPHHNQKDKLERQLHDVFMRRFAHQKRLLETRLPVFLGSKTVIDYTFLTDDNLDEGAESEEIIRLILVGAVDGIALFKDGVSIGVDWSKVNTAAAEWARKYVGELIKGIDQTTLDAVRQAVYNFVNTPGMTIGDVIGQLPFDEVRAWKIAITETTRAYAEAQKLAGEQLKEQFPDVKVVKQWFTNNDDLVCDICAPMNNEEVEMSETFSSGDDNPPAHVNCRCWMSTGTDING